MLVYIFVSTGRFQSLENVHFYIDPTYTEDGDIVPSVFIKEIGLTNYEPNCIEAIYSVHKTVLGMLLAKASYAQQWLDHVDGTIEANAAICVFAPNQVSTPNNCSLGYCGAFVYNAVFD